MYIAHCSFTLPIHQPEKSPNPPPSFAFFARGSTAGSFERAAAAALLALMASDCAALSPPPPPPPPPPTPLLLPLPEAMA